MTKNKTQPKQLNIYQKLLEVQKKDLTFTKNAKSHYGKYLTLDDLNKGLNPTLNEIGLIVVHKTHKRNIVTMVIDTDTGKSLKSYFPIAETITDPQKVGSAITYAKRYNIGQLFNIVTDEDDDGDATTEKTTSPQKEPFRDKKINGRTIKKSANPTIHAHCSDCQTEITEAENEYSVKNHGIKLCRECQGKYKRKI